MHGQDMQLQFIRFVDEFVSPDKDVSLPQLLVSKSVSVHSILIWDDFRVLLFAFQGVLVANLLEEQPVERIPSTMAPSF